MSNEITKQPALSKAASKALAEHGLHVKVGDTVIELSRGDIYRVSKITSKGVEIQHRWWDKKKQEYEWCGGDSYDFARFKKDYAVLDKPFDQVVEESLKAAVDLSKYEDELPQESECTDLAAPVSKGAMIHAIGLVEAKKRELQVIRAILERKMSYLNHLVHEQEEKLKKMRTVLTTVELYLGIYEEIIVLREGEPAPIDTPVSIRQMLLFMDEEIAIIEEGGLDAMDLDKFDEWLLDPRHLDQVLPEQKGVVALRVRRDKKRYEDIWTQLAMDGENHKTYFLIRNGEQLYRIWANLDVSPRLFPLKNEFEKYVKDPDSLSHFDERDLEKKELTYKQNIVVLQGLLDRTEVFHPIGHERINLLDPNTWNGRIRLIADDEAALPSGRLPYYEWRKEINGKIQIGSHVVYGGRTYGESDEDHKYHSHYTHTAYPSRGVYQIMGRRCGPRSYPDKMWYFLYNPGDEIWPRSPYDRWHERKRRIAWFFHARDYNILNYDQIGLDDIEYYLTNRTDRKHYIDMLPLLIALKKRRTEELEREKLFVALVVNRLKCPEEDVWKAVDWWKHKNKWKRPIDQDDAKALRMIEKHLQKNEVTT